MIKKYSAVGVLSIFLILSSLSAKADHELDRCSSSDAVCVGKVLLNKLNQLGDSPNNLTIEFYHDDYCRDELLITVTFTDNVSKNDAQCRKLSKLVDQRVWGVKTKGGACINIADEDFLRACLEFI